MNDWPQESHLVHNDDAVVPDGGANVPAQSLQHVDGAGNLLYLDFDFAVIGLLGVQRKDCKEQETRYGTRRFSA